MRKKARDNHTFTKNDIMEKNQDAALPSVSCDTEFPTLRSIDPSVLVDIRNLLGTSKPRTAFSKQRKMPKLVERRLALEDMGKSRKCLKPGVSSLKDVHRVTRASCTTIGRKRVVGVDGDGKPSDMLLTPVGHEEGHFSSPERTPGSSFTLFNSHCPQRKRLSTPSTPSTPVTQMSWTGAVTMDCGGDSLLEALPLDLLVRIVCGLHHDELKPVFHVCRRLRTAVLIARQWHFNFTTPDRERQEKLGLSTPRPEEQWPFPSAAEIQAPLIRPPTPRAPRHLTKVGQARISLPEMRQIAATLFQGSTPHRLHTKPPNLQRAICRGTASHRVLFYEEELCQAVAQNTI